MSEVLLRVELGERSYPIHIGGGLLDRAAAYEPHVKGRRAAIVTNATVAALYAQRVEAALAAAGASTLRIVVPDGEAFKNWQTLDNIHSALLEARADRRTVVIALGGGVVGDMAGFAAATYQRGIGHVQVPTTLLAQVDSSVGGKTAINHALGKNMVGAFHQPSAVIADTASLSTLPSREYAAGLAEVVKYGAIQDLELLEWIETHVELLRARDQATLIHVIRRSCEIKAEVVALDERENGARALLNFGHTFGHAIESAAGYGNWLHGEAVAIGMALAARFSSRAGRLPEAQADRLVNLLRALGLPVDPPNFPPEVWLEFMGRDKKNERGGITLILLDGLGRAAVVRDTPAQALRDFLAST